LFLAESTPVPLSQLALGRGLAVESQAVGPHLPPWITPELIEKTIKVWQPYYGFQLTRDDALGILLSVSRLFRILSQE
jgi:hypothetical protein